MKKLTKREMIKEMYIENAKKSYNWEFYYIHEDETINRIDRNRYAWYIEQVYNAYKNGRIDIEQAGDILHFYNLGK